VKAFEQFRRYLVANGLKVTSERLAIAEATVETEGHFDVDTLLHRLRGRRVAASRATLYRTLAHLIDSGLVQRITASDGNARYESMAGRTQHDHMVCRECGGIQEFVAKEIGRLLDAASRRQGFRRTGHALRVEGYCDRCSGKARKGRGTSGNDRQAQKTSGRGGPSDV